MSSPALERKKFDFYNSKRSIKPNLAGESKKIFSISSLYTINRQICRVLFGVKKSGIKYTAGKQKLIGLEREIGAREKSRVRSNPLTGVREKSKDFSARLQAAETLPKMPRKTPDSELFRKFNL